MEIKDVKLKRYIPSDGMALKITRDRFGCNGIYKETSYSNSSVIMYEDDLSISIEEVPVQEYEKWVKEKGCCMGVGALI